VRELERILARVARKLALAFLEGKDHSEWKLEELLGPKRFLGVQDQLRKDGAAGVATGLAWTEMGGDVLYIEAVTYDGQKGKGALLLTGQLGDVMKESAQAAQSFVLSRVNQFRPQEVHIHVPAGAIPKDGPSAGVTMATALFSAYTGQAVRKGLAMTGEITLTGLVLPVGGIKEKVLAARRAGFLEVVLPRENQKDILDLPEHVRQEMTFHWAEVLDDVFSQAFPDSPQWTQRAA